MKKSAIVSFGLLLVFSLAVSAMAQPPSHARNKQKSSRTRVQRALDQRSQALKRNGRTFSPAAQKAFEKRRAQYGTGRLGNRADSRNRSVRSNSSRRGTAQSSERSQFGRMRAAEAQGRVTLGTTANTINEKTHPHAQRLLDKRLMQIEKMRDLGVKNDNANMLRQADHLEETARRQFVQRTSATSETGDEAISESTTESPRDVTSLTRRADGTETTRRRSKRKRRFTLDIFGLFKRKN